MSPTCRDMSARHDCVAPILARWVRVADTKLKMSWQFVSAQADIYQIFRSAYVEIYYGMGVHTHRYPTLISVMFWFVMFSSLSCSGTTHTHTTLTRIENTHNSHNEKCTTAPSAHASYKGYGCNNAKPPRPPHRNTMINVVVLGLGVVRFGRARERRHRLSGCIFLTKFGRWGGLLPWPNRDGRT